MYINQLCAHKANQQKLTLFGDGFVLKILIILLHPSKLNFSYGEKNLSVLEGAFEGQELKLAVKENSINQI